MDKIRIQGYKSFRDLELTLKRINILIGANGSGKSNFLSFFELLNQLYNQNLQLYVASNGGSQRFLHKGPKVTDSIRAHIADGKNGYSFTLSEGDGHFFFAEEKLWYYRDAITITTMGQEARIKTYSGAERGSYIKSYLHEIKKYHFHDTGKTSPFTHESSIENDKHELYAHGSNLASFLHHILQSHPVTYQRIIDVIRSVAPYFSDFYYAPSPSGTLRLLWRDRYSENIYGPNDLSDGTLRFIALTTLFLQPRPPRVIIIDEPELGLHPLAISKLAGLIKSVTRRGTQVIIATQSADLISQFDAHDIITVDQRNGETSMRRLDEDSLGQWLADYTIGELWKQQILKGGQPA